jgi:excinuclease ABC subunit A
MTHEASQIVIKGAREHNLQEVDLVLPKNKLICFSGVSGSGKSSLAFDTLYAEGQRRYIESLSSYARQFMGQLAKPDCDHVSGLAPSISIEQKAGASNPRSTVGTITEIHDYLRVLFARIGRGHCPKCQRPIEAQSREQMVAAILHSFPEQRVLLLAPMVRNQKGEFRDFFDDLLKRGYIRARVDGELLRLADSIKLDRQMRHHIEVVVDRLTPSAQDRTRLADAVHQALSLSGGELLVLHEENPAKKMLLSAKYACPTCQISFEPPSPQLFSFNSPQGMCPACDGLGENYTFDPDLLIPDPSLSFRDGAIELVGTMREMGRWRRHIFEGVAQEVGFSLDTPWNKLAKSGRDALLYGLGDQHVTFVWRSRGRVQMHGGTWDGIVPQLIARHKKTGNAMQRRMLEKYMRVIPCETCHGQRLNAQARHVRLGGKSLLEWEGMPVDELLRFIDDSLDADLTPVERHIAAEPVKEIRARLGFLLNVGLQYLALDRRANTLSGGEAQRIRLASQIGSGLVGVLYVLDEPSIGLHPRDNHRLLATLEHLRDQGNTVLVVEHDEETMRAADYLVDFGPGPGVRGGKVVAQGSLADLVGQPESVTGQYLAGKRRIEVPTTRRPVDPATRPVGSSPTPRTKPPKNPSTAGSRRRPASAAPSEPLTQKKRRAT